jgi:hypothetical protein
MDYQENVRLLAKLMGITNPDSIPEEELGIERLVYRNEAGEAFIVDATAQNRGGRLFWQDVATHQDRKTFAYVAHSDYVNFGPGFKQAAADFFSDIWGDFSPVKRTLLYGIATYTSVEIFWKEGFFD